MLHVCYLHNCMGLPVAWQTPYIRCANLLWSILLSPTSLGMHILFHSGLQCRLSCTCSGGSSCAQDCAVGLAYLLCIICLLLQNPELHSCSLLL